MLHPPSNPPPFAPLPKQRTRRGVVEISGERYVALPAGTPVRPAFTMDERPYLKLSRE